MHYRFHMDKKKRTGSGVAWEITGKKKMDICAMTGNICAGCAKGYL